MPLVKRVLIFVLTLIASTMPAALPVRPATKHLVVRQGENSGQKASEQKSRVLARPGQRGEMRPGWLDVGISRSGE